LSPSPAPDREGALKLTFYFGEHDRHRGRYLSEAILGLFERYQLAISVLLRGAEGFGAAQRLQTDRLLSLSEDLPLVAVAVDRADLINSAAAELARIAGDGLLTLERARLAFDHQDQPGGVHGEVKLTVYTGRGERQGGAPAHRNVVEALHRHGVAGATVLLGVDGTLGARRTRARFFASNADVPAMTIAVGERGRIGAALADLRGSLEHHVATLEAVRVCRRDGRALARPLTLPDLEPSGLGIWTKLMVYCSERSEYEGHALYLELIRRLRAEGGAGATALRGVWGYHGEHDPHGDRLLALRRQIPIVTVIVDKPSCCERWFEIATELTAETGLLTSETVPALRISGPAGHLEGGLRLANPSP
jgi:PII-like signaling protein